MLIQMLALQNVDLVVLRLTLLVWLYSLLLLSLPVDLVILILLLLDNSIHDKPTLAFVG